MNAQISFKPVEFFSRHDESLSLNDLFADINQYTSMWDLA